MDRREFVKWLGLMAAGAAALPQQIEAFTDYYEANSPPINQGLIAVDEIMLGGIASVSMPTALTFVASGKLLMPSAINLFGGVLRWTATPDQKRITTAADVDWNIQCSNYDLTNNFTDYVRGHISYIDSRTLIRETVQFTRAQSTLAEELTRLA